MAEIIPITGIRTSETAFDARPQRLRRCLLQLFDALDLAMFKERKLNAALSLPTLGKKAEAALLAEHAEEWEYVDVARAELRDAIGAADEGCRFAFACRLFELVLNAGDTEACTMLSNITVWHCRDLQSGLGGDAREKDEAQMAALIATHVQEYVALDRLPDSAAA